MKTTVRFVEPDLSSDSGYREIRITIDEAVNRQIAAVPKNYYQDIFDDDWQAEALADFLAINWASLVEE